MARSASLGPRREVAPSSFSRAERTATKKPHLGRHLHRLLRPRGELEGLQQRRDGVPEPLHLGSLEPRFPTLVRSHEVLDGPGQEVETVGGRAIQGRRVVEPVHQGPRDVEGAQEGRHGLALVDARVGAVTLRVVGQGRTKVSCEADVVHDEPRRLRAEDAVHAGDGLHQAMPLHRLVDVERVQGWSVEAREPHVPHDREPQLVPGVPQALRQGLAACLGPDVGLIGLRVRGVPRHDDLHRPCGVVVRVPFGPGSDDAVVDLDADAPAHADDHGLAVHRLEPGVEVREDVGDHGVEPSLRTHEGLDAGPLALDVFRLALGELSGRLVEGLVEVRHRGVVEVDLRDPALVVDRDRRAVLDGLGDVVDVDVVAEH